MEHGTEEIEHVDDDVESLISPPITCMSRSSVHSDRNQSISSPSSTPVSSKGSKRKRKTRVDEQADEVLTMVGERLRNNGTDNDDAFNIFEKHVAAKLRTLPKQTKLYTEKLINDLLFEAEIGNIDKNTKIVTLANNPYLQSTEYASPAASRLLHQQPQYQSFQSVSASPQTDTNVSTFFGTYQPTEDKN